jgi:hypothetical protein
LFNLSVSGALAKGANIQDSTFEADRRIETDLAFYEKESAKVSAETDCKNDNCALLIKSAIVKKNNAEALKLLLAHHGVNDAERLPEGAYGYTELFTDEYYLWHQARSEISIEKLGTFDEKSVAKPKSGRRYLVHLPQRNLFLQRKISPPREAILVDARADLKTPVTDKAALKIAAPAPATLYSALQARWGGKNKGKSRITVQIKPPFDGASGDLHIYTQPVALDALGQLKPNGYHLVCAAGESYNNFAIFALTMVENMADRGQGVEAAYESALKSQKGKQASTRPLYFLYRN